MMNQRLLTILTILLFSFNSHLSFAGKSSRKNKQSSKQQTKKEQRKLLARSKKSPVDLLESSEESEIPLEVIERAIKHDSNDHVLGSKIELINGDLVVSMDHFWKDLDTCIYLGPTNSGPIEEESEHIVQYNNKTCRKVESNYLLKSFLRILDENMQEVIKVGDYAFDSSDRHGEVTHLLVNFFPDTGDEEDSEEDNDDEEEKDSKSKLTKNKINLNLSKLAHQLTTSVKAVIQFDEQDIQIINGKEVRYSRSFSHLNSITKNPYWAPMSKNNK